MHEYELTFILRTDVEAGKSKRLTDRLEKSIAKYQGTLVGVEDLGDKALAYPIHKEGRGHYYLWRLRSQGDLIVELENYLRIAPEVLRFLTVRVIGAADSAEKQ